MGVDAMFLVLLGPPGSGKGTQAALLSEQLGLPALSTGDVVRAAIASGSELGRRVERIVAAGELVDDRTMGDIVRARLAAADVARGCLLDGYPRTASQAQTLASILEASNRRLSAVIKIDVAAEELVGRMLGRGRADDREEVIRRRMRVYEEQTAPLVEHYRALGVLVEIDGNRGIEAVNAAIRSALAELGAARLQEVEG